MLRKSFIFYNAIWAHSINRKTQMNSRGKTQRLSINIAR